MPQRDDAAPKVLHTASVSSSESIQTATHYEYQSPRLELGVGMTNTVRCKVPDHVSPLSDSAMPNHGRSLTPLKLSQTIWRKGCSFSVHHSGVIKLSPGLVMLVHAYVLRLTLQRLRDNQG